MSHLVSSQYCFSAALYRYTWFCEQFDTDIPPSQTCETRNATTLKPPKPEIVGMLTAIVGPGRKTYLFSHAFVTRSSSALLRNATKDVHVGESNVVLHLPGLNALDFEDYLSYLVTGISPLAPITPSTIPKEFAAYERLIWLYNTGCELGDARFQNACVDEALQRYRTWGVFPAEQVLRELLKDTRMWRLMADIYRTSWSVERFRDMRGKVPVDFLWAVVEGFMEVRDGAEAGSGFEDACVYHLHDRLWPRSMCGLVAMEYGDVARDEEGRHSDTVLDWPQRGV